MVGQPKGRSAAEIDDARELEEAQTQLTKDGVRFVTNPQIIDNLALVGLASIVVYVILTFVLFLLWATG